MTKIDLLFSNGFSLFEEVKTDKDLIYCWANESAILGIGRHRTTSGVNFRVNPSLSEKKILSTKDAGKSFIAAFVAKQTGQNMNLYSKIDDSSKTSQISSRGEKDMAALLVDKKFLSVGTTSYKKIEFMNKIVRPTVVDTFGLNSMEDVVCSLAARDGDMWSRFYGHKVSLNAAKNIIRQLCLINLV